MIGATLCSGIGAPECAAPWIDWAWHAEIDPFASAVHAHRFPGSANLGDMTADDFVERAAAVALPDVIVAGLPCQAFSVAGLRRSLEDDRGNLTLRFVRIVDAIDHLRRAAGKPPAFVVWENVPGVLSVGDNAFGAFLAGLVGRDAAVEPPRGRGWTDAGVVSGPRRCAAWRCLDAQFFGLAQRRKRVFVLARGGAGDWAAADALLPVVESLRWHPAPGREAGPGAAVGTLRSTDGGSDVTHGTAGRLIPELAGCVTAREHKGPDSDCTTTLVAHTLRAEGFDASEDGTGRGTPLVPVAFGWNKSPSQTMRVGEITDALQASPTSNPAIAFSCKDYGADASDISPTLRAMGHDGSHANAGGQVAVATVGVHHAYASKAGSVEALRALRDQVGAEAFRQWSLGVLASLLPAEILRQEVHGCGVRRATEPQRGVVGYALSRQKAGAGGAVPDLWEAGCDGRPPQGWRPSEQLSRELGAYLSGLPYSPSPAQRVLQDLRQADEGLGLLRQALSTVQEAWRSVGGEGQPAHGLAVRRLIVEECEALQGFPRGFTAIPYRGKPAAADGPRYKALGNSMAVPVMRWLLERVRAVTAERETCA